MGGMWPHTARLSWWRAWRLCFPMQRRFLGLALIRVCRHAPASVCAGIGRGGRDGARSHFVALRSASRGSWKVACVGAVVSLYLCFRLSDRSRAKRARSVCSAVAVLRLFPGASCAAFACRASQIQHMSLWGCVVCFRGKPSHTPHSGMAACSCGRAAFVCAADRFCRAACWVMYGRRRCRPPQNTWIPKIWKTV